MTLEEKLSALSAEGTLPMHMPGHKRHDLGGGLPWERDVTEVKGFDDLHDARGILRQAMNRAALLYGADRTYFLVNGSTGGVLAGVFAAADRGDTVIAARNCHRSVYNALELRGVKTRFVTPEYGTSGIAGSVSPEKIEKAFTQCPGARLVIITSPTYEGTASDIRSIARIVHSRGAALLVDEAHGAHFGFSPFFPESSVHAGADIVIHGAHKTLPCLTQTAFLHLNRGRVSEERLSRYLSVFQTSSPSYPLMQSLDMCTGLLSKRSVEIFGAYEKALRSFYGEASRLEKLSLLYTKERENPAFFALDPGKLVILTSGASVSAPRLAETLREDYGIETEMTGPDFVLAMTGILDGERELSRLSRALLAADERAGYAEKGKSPLPSPPLPESVMSACDAREEKSVKIPLEKSAGTVSACALWAYPPGVPLIIPGERVSGELIDYISALSGRGVELRGEGGTDAGEISVLTNAV